ncbi:hypothetical protein DEF23_00630 [Marinitenerispora sediminis]|uniref:Uncharacterized protein n=1 Tax=Marinitenerispora sediminis TaxID=1931232 RepID=A0A368TB35_9ACTN|nr:hypothetical protein DEF28_04880 [Marinitenerispora sediminis]RCV62005.1 hypothetical protein DEF24_02860 [Marinitenerispora sediminis]RCV62018.1 hypothetical protein DEF23_00630 [Marinitenerispora sediminis]
MRFPRAWRCLVLSAGAVLGFGAAFVVGPVVDGLVRVADGAPAPLRIAAQLPLGWAVPVLTITGLVLGAWIVREWERENPVVTVGGEEVVVRRAGVSLRVGRGLVDGVFTDGHDLVLVDRETVELVRVHADRVLVSGLRQAFQRFGYPWRGEADPHEAAFAAWVDRDPALGEQAHALLRARHRALADKQAGAADDARDALRDLGVAVRDRRGGQQYRRTSRPRQGDPRHR